VAERACVGRGRELARLQRHVAAAARGHGGLVVVRGPMGIGKTTVARWCMDAAAAAGGAAFMVAAPGPEREAPMGLWTRLAGSAQSRHGVPAVLLDGAAEQVHPHVRYAATLSLLRVLDPSPVVVVLDDLHRADESSAATLAQLAPALSATGVLIVATWRATATEVPEALDVLAPWTEFVELGHLDADGVQALVAAVAGPGAEEWAAAVAPVLAARSGGNPLVLEAMLDELAVGGGARPDAAALASMPLERAAADVLGRRLEGLTREATEMLGVVALVGGEVPRALLREVLGRDPAVDVAAATAAGVLEPQPDGSMGFVHPSLGELVHGRVGEAESAWRARIASALRRRGRPQDLPAIAHHLSAAGRLVPPDELRSAAVSAADQALRVGDHAAAARTFDLALGAGSVEDRLDLLLRSAAAHHAAGHREIGWSRAREAADLAGDDRPGELARAALAFAQDRRYTTEQEDAVALLHRALAALGDDHSLRREVLASCALLEMARPVPSDIRELDQLPGRALGDGDAAQTFVAWNWVHPVDVARPMADQALALARATGDDELVARVAMAWRQTHCAPEFLADRLATSAHAMRAARLPADRVPAAIASVLDNLEDGRRAAVDRALEELIGLAAATGDPTARWRAGHLAGMVALASGRPDVAHHHVVEAFAHGAQAGESGRWVVRGVQATLLALEVEAEPGPTIQFLAANADELVYPPLRAGAAYSLARVGRIDDATRYLPGLVAQITEDQGREASWLMTGALAADAVAAVGDAELAGRLLAALLPFADRIAVDGVGFHCHGCLGRPLSRLAHVTGDHDLARSLRATALERDGAAGLRRWVLDGAVDALAARHSEGSIDQGALRSGVNTIAGEAEALGLLRTAGRARALLHRGTADQLTTRQRDVLAALADGHTYQSAAERLGFSHSTIRHEAIRVYAALGARDREEALRTARDLGLVSGGTGESADGSGG
jgi:DNA-binding CsgD family transcriptional regulator